MPTGSRGAIINLLLEHGALSRADLARLTHLRRTTISASVAELLAEGVIQEVGIGDSTGGRKPVLLRLGGDHRLIVGVGLVERRCRFVVTNVDGQVIEWSERSLGGAHGLEVLRETIAAGVRELFGGRPAGSLLGCGVGMSGMVDAANDLVFSSFFDKTSVPLRPSLESDLGVPVMVLDNAHAAALGELWLRGRELRQNLVYLYLGKGVGGALVLGRDLYRGSNHAAGELGPLCVDADGPLFPCGHRGCLEGFVASEWLLGRLQQSLADGQTSRLRPEMAPSEVVGAIAAAAEQGDEVALDLTRYAAYYVGVATANLINLLNPDEIILGGPMAVWGERFAELVYREAEGRSLSVPFRSVRILPGQPEAETVPLGAAALVIKQAASLLRRR